MTMRVAYINTHSDKEDMVMIPMRDGVRLYSLIIFPKGQARQNLPTVLIRIPYLIRPDALSFPRYVRSFLEHGYAVVFEYWRGRYYSEGTYKEVFEGAGADGYDTVEWLAKQPWSNGKIGALRMLIERRRAAEAQRHASTPFRGIGTDGCRRGHRPNRAVQ